MTKFKKKLLNSETKDTLKLPTGLHDLDIVNSITGQTPDIKYQRYIKYQRSPRYNRIHDLDNSKT